jgi:hypothetical protein
MLRKALAVTSTIAVTMLAFVPQALAVQEHGDPEGFFVHQLAHLIFIASMVFMMHVLKKPTVSRVKGWRSIRWAALFFLLWNADAFIAHIARREMDQAGGYIQGSVIYLKDLPANTYYYLSLMEYFFLVPAFIFLAMGLFRLRKYLESEA